ncbi:MAG: putative acetyltransferase protein [Phycisphaerales bacterium]|nr:putative acetyltransferase protein [Phycisphaerales bacterium]
MMPMIPPDTIRITPATRADVPLILDLIRGLADYEKLSHEVVATEDLLLQHLFGPRPAAEVLLAYRGDHAVGFALYFQSFSTFLGRPGIYLEDVYVRPEVRGKGVGKALLREVARVAMARACGRLEWSVLDWNEPALRFYKSLGAKPMDEWTVHRVTGDALRKLAGL